MSQARAFSLCDPAKLTIAASILFFVCIFLFSTRTPLMFDDGFNANVALSLAQGRGYGTHVGREFIPFNPFISTGALFIAPFSLVIGQFGPSLVAVEGYSLVVTFFFFCIALVGTWRLHRYMPLILIAFSAVFLLHGKTDLVPHTGIRNLPAPLYGLWFQFLGNMSGIWAAAAALVVCAGLERARFRDLLLIFLCAAFACNAKVVHALPLTVGLSVLFLGRPRLMGRAFLVGLVGAYVGVRADTWLARMALSAEDFERHQGAAKEFFLANQGFYVDLLRSPNWEGLFRVINNIGAHYQDALGYVGYPLSMLVCIMGCLAVASCCRLQSAEYQRLLLLMLSLLTSSIGIVLWWAGLPAAPIRFLTSAPPLIVTAGACAFLISLRAVQRSVRALSLVAGTLFLLVSVCEGISGAPRALSTCRAARKEQQRVAALVTGARLVDSNRLLCGVGWWHPHEIAFLSGSPETIACGSSAHSLAVIPKHIFPREVVPLIRPASCVSAFSGKFYKLATCEAPDAVGG